MRKYGSSHTQKARKLGARGCHICNFKSKTVLMIIFYLSLGGKMNFILIGGAPLSQTTHDFIRVCLGSIVVQGYSLTESTCTGTVMENCDLTSNTVGAPMTGKFIFFVCLFVFIFILFGVHSINKQTKPILNKLSTTYAGFKKVCTIFLIIKIFFTF